MKKHLLGLSKYVAAVALVITSMSVNCACIFFSHQEELPTGADKLRKNA